MSNRCDTQNPELAILLPLQAALTLASVDELPDHVRVQVLVAKVHPAMKPEKIVRALHLFNRPWISIGSSRAGNEFTVVPLDEKRTLHLSFIESELQRVEILDEHHKPVFMKEYGKR